MKILLKIIFLINISNITLIINACVIKCERKQIGFWYMVCKNDKPFQSKTPNYHWYLLIYRQNVTQKYVSELFQWTVERKMSEIGWSSNWKELYVWVGKHDPNENNLLEIDGNGNIKQKK